MSLVQDLEFRRIHKVIQVFFQILIHTQRVVSCIGFLACPTRTGGPSYLALFKLVQDLEW